MVHVDKTKYLVGRKTFSDSIGASACRCGSQTPHIMHVVLPEDKTNYVVVYKTFSDSIGPSAFVYDPQASYNRNTVLSVDTKIWLCTRHLMILKDHLH